MKLYYCKSFIVPLLLLFGETSAGKLRNVEEADFSYNEEELAVLEQGQRRLNGGTINSGDRPVQSVPITEEEIPNGVGPEVGIIAHALPLLDAEMSRYQLTIQFRLLNYLSAIWWNCVAAYSPDYKDALTKERPSFYATNTNLHTSYYRSACLAQATATYSELAMPDVNPAFFNFMARNSKISLQRPVSSMVESCRGRESCYRDLVRTVGFSPLFMGQIIGKRAYDISLEDGFNQLGTDNCTANCRPYMDTTGYLPKPFPYTNATSDPHRNSWEPLMEDNGRGYYSYQQHITPHIGQKAKFHYLPESERMTRVSPTPSYSDSLESEAQVVLDRMAALNDNLKIQAEQFDTKTVIARALMFSFVNKLKDDGYEDQDLKQPTGNHGPQGGYFLSMERFVHFLQTYYAARYDAVIIAWKEKIRHDVIRPTTVIKRMGGGEAMIRTWTSDGVTTFPSERFEAYIKVSPHSEYVSGSACIVTTEKEVINGYLERLGLNSTSFPVTFLPVAAGGSLYEPGRVPAAEVTLMYTDMNEYAEAGGQSRIDCGTHFEGSVIAGEELCTGIASYVLDGSFDLY